MKDRFDLIIFDWDGTLVDSIDWIVHCFQHTADKLGYEIPDDQIIKNIIGLSIQKALEKLFPGCIQNNQERFIICYGKEYFSRETSFDDLFTGVHAMLHELKQSGYQLAVATGKTASGLEKALQETGLRDFFDSTRCADQTASKPKPVMLEEIITETAVSKEKAVMVGDSIHDMQMAINAGISFIAVSCGANTYEQLKRYNPLLNLNQTTELIDRL